MIEKGLSSKQISRYLKVEKVISSEIIFRLILKTQGIEKKIQAGEYLFEKSLTLRDVIVKLKKGENYYRKVIIPEGSTSFEVVNILNKNKYISGSLETLPEEGTLFPDTYFFSRNESINLLLIRMENKMKSELNKAWLEGKNIFKNKLELLTFASLIESETKKTNEKYLVSSVFHNRLKTNMKLQSDSSVLYGKNYYLKDKTRSLFRKDLKKDTFWNTYTRKGLPATPICNPGLVSLKAAINPAKTKYLFFVSDGLGGHRFSQSLEDHVKNIKIWKSMNK